jgi:hypothetical protein
LWTRWILLKKRETVVKGKIRRLNIDEWEKL